MSTLTVVPAVPSRRTAVLILQTGRPNQVGQLPDGKKTSILIKAGLPGVSGPPGRPGEQGEGYQDPGDLTLIFENKLV